ncbi:MAG: preprotein translocase subunit YajC [Gammaproteobacteria bacterium]|nr:preprotein translocase subunit YajC [Gammaproteobacteria bacterium]
MGFFIQDAWAQGAPPASDPWLSMLPLVIIFVVFYFLLIRPQQKRQKEHKEMVAKLAAGDEVVTAGGVLGKVVDVSESFIRVEVANGVQVIVQRHTIGTVLPKGTIKNA